MSRIPDELIERVKAIPLEPLAVRAGIVFKRHGEDLVGFCVFHVDKKTPNMVLTPVKNVFHCFACGAAGSPIDWVMRLEGVRFRAAVEILLLEFFPDEARALGIGVAPRRSTVPELPPPFDPEASELEIARGVVRYYNQQLKETPDALDFLGRRGLDTPEVIEGLQLGFSDRSLGKRLPLGNRKAGHAVRTALQKLGFYRDTDREHFIGCVTVPFFDEKGDVAGMYGRKIQPNLPKNARHLYRPGPRRGILNRGAFQTSKEIILCEAPFDAATFLRWGFGNVTTSFGAGGFTDELLSAFVTHGIERCFIAYDRDGAGDDGARKAAEKLMAHSIECFRVLFPKGMDANEYALKVQPGDKSLGVLLRGAEWMGNGTRPRSARTDEAARAASEAARAALSSVAPSSATEGPLEATKEDDGQAAKEENRPEATREAGLVSRIERSSQAEATLGAVSASVEVVTEDSGSSSSAAAPVALPAPAPVMLAPASARESETAGHTNEKAGGPKNGTHVTAVDELVSRVAPLVAGGPPPAPTYGVIGLTKLTEDEADFAFDDRRYSARGFRKCLTADSLRLSLRAERLAEGLFAPPSPLLGFHLDTLDLCAHRQRAAFEKHAAREMAVEEDVVHRDLGGVLRIFEEVRKRRIVDAQSPKQKTVAMSEEEIADGLDFWKSPDLMQRIVEHFTACGLVGEATNKLVTYIAACSRLLDRPLAIIIQSSSAAGKSALMEALLGFMPEEMREKYTAVSGKSLFYFDEGTVLKHKILAIVEEEGAEKATYPLKLLQSEGELIMASTGKDPATGKLVTKIYKVEGPVMIILTTTSFEIDPELENRCLRLTVDESREQTRAIHEQQRMRMTFEGFERKAEKERLKKRHQNAQRLLRKINVYNPFSKRLTFVDDETRTRRDHDKYLTLIETIALMHQYQRPIYRRAVDGKEEEFLDVTLSDLELAGRLAGEVLGQSLDDLQPQTRAFLLVLHKAVTKVCEESGVARSDLRFTRRQLRELTGFRDTQMRVHMARLIELEYVLVHRGGRGQSFVYELLYDGEGMDDRPFVLGLVDVDALRRELAGEPSMAAGSETATPTVETAAPEMAAPALEPTPTNPTSRGPEGYFAGGVRGGCGGDAGGVRGDVSGPEPAPGAAFDDSERETAKNAQLPASGETQAYTHSRSDTPNAKSGPMRPVLVNLLRFPPQPKTPDRTEGGPVEATITATVTPIAKPTKRARGGRSGRPLRRVQPDSFV